MPRPELLESRELPNGLDWTDLSPKRRRRIGEVPAFVEPSTPIALDTSGPAAPPAATATNPWVVFTDPLNGKDDYASAVVVDGSGRPTVIGYSNGKSGSVGYTLARYTTGATLDTTFNGTGIKAISTKGALADAGAIQGDGKILIAGHEPTSVSTDAFSLLRLNPNGSLDTTFNGSGKVLTAVGGLDTAKGVTLDSQSRIVVAGDAATNPSSLGYIAVMRYNSNGTPDASFTGPGAAAGTTTLSFPNSYAEARGVAVQSNNEVVVGGTLDSGQGNRALLVRFNTNGSLDTSFANGGVFDANVTPVPGMTWRTLNGVTVDSQDRILVTGGAIRDGETDISTVVARFTASGSLDTTFNNGAGYAIVDVSPNTTDVGTAVVDYSSSGVEKIAVGIAANADPAAGYSFSDFALAQFKADGTPDPTFNGTGIVRQNFNNYNEAVTDIAIGQLADGPHIYVTGEAQRSTEDFLTVRYSSTGQLDYV
jgi:uncharacterized delta-60 repeat protein